MTDPTKPHPDSNPDDRVPALALRLHLAVPAATDHPWRQFGNPARTQQHLVHRHRLDLDGEQGALLREQFTSPQQLHRFAHEPTEARAILAIALEPFVNQLLDILGQLPAELHPIILSETALAVRLGDGRAGTNRQDGNDRR